MKKQVTVSTTPSQVLAEHLDMVDDLRKKGLTNKQIVTMLQATYRQRRLDAVLSPGLLAQIRNMLRFLSKEEEVDDFWIAGLRDTLTRSQGDRFEDLAPKEEGHDS